MPIVIKDKKEWEKDILGDSHDTTEQEKECPLTLLANKYKTDKGTARGANNGYTYTYEHYFRNLKDSKIKFLEIGLNNGGPECGSNKIDRKIEDYPSIKMWHEYFSKGEIWGFDVNELKDPIDKSLNRFHFFQGDQGSEDSLKDFNDTVKEKYGDNVQFDIIIDDGSHAHYHQQLSFTRLAGLVKPGGYYVIEDIHWQPDHRRLIKGKLEKGEEPVYDKSQLPETVQTKSLIKKIVGDPKKHNPEHKKSTFKRFKKLRPEFADDFINNMRNFTWEDPNPSGKCPRPGRLIILHRKKE